mgnify:CR=1 FL=1
MRLRICILIYLYSIDVFAQIDPLLLKANGQTGDINFQNCASLADIHFSSGYTYAQGNVRYTWKLYKDNLEINEHVQPTHLTTCKPALGCESPQASFTSTPTSGNYKIRLIADRFLCIPFPPFCIETGTLYDIYSNSIKVKFLNQLIEFH